MPRLHILDPRSAPPAYPKTSLPAYPESPPAYPKTTLPAYPLSHNWATLSHYPLTLGHFLPTLPACLPSPYVSRITSCTPWAALPETLEEGKRIGKRTKREEKSSPKIISSPPPFTSCLPSPDWHGTPSPLSPGPSP